MRYLSVCSGIEAASVAWHGLGWTPVAFSEIEKFPRAVLAHHYPDVPLHGDFTTIGEDDYGPIDLLVGGTPCQSFSIAGLRGGLDDDRGNLALEFLRLAQRKRPKWLVWENVPGVFSSLSHTAPDPRPPEIDLDCDGGPEVGEEIVVEDEYDADESHAFSCFLAGLSELGYGFAYRVFDAQYFGVAQRRRRVFVVGYLGDWRPAAAVLSERESLCGHPPPSRETGAGVAALTANGVGTCGADDNQGQAGHLIPAAYGGNNTSGPINVATALNACGTAAGRQDFETETFVAQIAPTLQHNGKAAGSATQQDAETGALVAHTLRGEGFDASEDGTGRGMPLVPVAFSAKDHGADAAEDISPTLRAGGHDRSHANSGNWMAVAVSLRGRDGGATAELGGEVCPAIRTGGGGGDKPHVLTACEIADTLSVGANQTTGFQGDICSVGDMAVRRLTPRECERLQGFPDDYTMIPWRGKPAEDCPDGPRYKALGNSMAVPVMSWLGQRIQMVEGMMS